MNINKRFQINNDEPNDEEYIFCEHVTCTLIPPAKAIKNGDTDRMYVEFVDIDGNERTLCIDPRELIKIYQIDGDEICSAAQAISNLESS